MILVHRDGSGIEDRGALGDIIVILQGEGKCRRLRAEIARTNLSLDLFPFVRKQGDLVLLGPGPFLNTEIEGQPRLRIASGLQGDRLGLGLGGLCSIDCLG